MGIAVHFRPAEGALTQGKPDHPDVQPSAGHDLTPSREEYINLRIVAVNARVLERIKRWF